MSILRGICALLCLSPDWISAWLFLQYYCGEGSTLLAMGKILIFQSWYDNYNLWNISLVYPDIFRRPPYPLASLWVIAHFSDVIMRAMASQITGVFIVCSDADQRKYRSSASLIFVRGICQWPGQYRGKYFHLMTSSYFSWRRSLGTSHRDILVGVPA